MQMIIIKNVMRCRDKFGAIMKGYMITGMADHA